MAKTLTYIVSLTLLLTGSVSALAQEIPTIKTAIDKNQILIGEPLRFSIDVKSPLTSGNELPQFDSIPHFEMIEKGSRDSLISASGTSYHLEWKLTSFDSGTRVIPSFTILIGKQLYKTDSLPVEVSYGKIDTAQDYHDIKGIRDLESPNARPFPGLMGRLPRSPCFCLYGLFETVYRQQ
jgi:hypothetical protein